MIGRRPKKVEGKNQASMIRWRQRKEERLYHFYVAAMEKGREDIFEDTRIMRSEVSG